MQPQDQAPAYTQPVNEAGKVLPPVETRFPPGRSGNPGGKPRGASIQAAILRDLAKDPDEDGIGRGAREVAQALMDVAAGRRAPDEVDTKAALALLDRTDGPIVKEIKSETTLDIQGGMELLDRRASKKDPPR